MLKSISILFLTFYSLVLCQDVYPYFSDPNKQMLYEEKKVYIIEKSGKDQYYTGGESYTELANLWGNVLFNEDPDYVVKQNPLRTHYKYYYEFKIKQGNNELTELQFLLAAGYSDKAEQIYQNYQMQIDEYNKEWKNYYAQLDYYNKNNRKITRKKRGDYTDTKLYNYLDSAFGVSFVIFVLESLFIIYMDGEAHDDAYKIWEISAVSTIGIYSSSFLFLIPRKIEYKEDSIIRPTEPQINKPVLQQVLSNHQIKSLAEAYNRRIYQSIKESN